MYGSMGVGVGHGVFRESEHKGHVQIVPVNIFHIDLERVGE